MSVSIVPRPEHVTLGPGTLVLGRATGIRFGDGCEAIARLFQQQLRPATGFDFPFVSSREATSVLVLDLDLDPCLDPSAYSVRVSEGGVTLIGGDGAGLFHATQTFLQLCPPDIFRRAVVADVPWAVPCVQVVDHPRFAWRGMLLDISRHFFGRQSILTLIDALALHRFNVLHLHLTDDQGWRIEIKKYPRLTSVGSWRSKSALEDTAELPNGREALYDGIPHSGYLNQDDIREIVTYARDRFITIVPEIDIPGHSQAAIAAYPHLGNTSMLLPVWTDWGVNPHVLNVDEETIRFYEDVLDEVLRLFPSEFIHIGGDECPKDEWRASPRAQERMRELSLADEDELQSWMITRFSEFLSDRGRRMVGWDEILQGGLAPGATVMSWQGTKGGIAAAEAGHDVVMTPESDTYLYRRQSDDAGSEARGALPVLPLETVYGYDPIPLEIADEAKSRVLGSQCSMWTEFVTSEREMHVMAFPRVCAFAEAVWCKERDSFEDFQLRLEPHYERLHAMGIDAHRPRQS